MELFFNELSLTGKESIDNVSILELIKVYRSLHQYNITTCRIDSVDNLKLFQLLQNMPDSLNIRNFYFSFFRPPYESMAVEQIQDEYFSYEWLLDDIPCVGLALAYILDSAGLSIYEKAVRNICTEGHVDIHISQLQLNEEPELIETDLQVEDKRISLRHDHGMDVLTEFSKRLIRCPYVIEVVNSLPFNPSERKFIRKIRDDGLIEIVLPWTDQKYGVVVKTTGRNIRETKRIGEIIKERYGGI